MSVLPMLTGFRLFLLLTTLLAATGAAAQESAAHGARDEPYFRYSAESAVPVVEYRLVHYMLANEDPQPLLRIYGNGRVQVHYPAYMQRAGDYEYTLTPRELDELLRALAHDGCMTFDPSAAAAERKQLADRERAAGQLRYISDTTETIMVVRLEEYRHQPGAAAIRNLEQRITWKNLEQDARRFPQSGALRGLATGAQRLHALLDHPGMQRVR